MLKHILMVYIFFVVISQDFVFAGPPFISDDPDAVPYKHGSTYLASLGLSDKNEFYAFLPHLEANYGLFKDTQIHMLVPFSLNKTKGKPAYYGPGIIELGVKYRFIQETQTKPQIGTYPLLELPTGDPKKGLGTGRLQLAIPIWLQKSWGERGEQWKTYGGGGYRIFPGINNKNFWYLGWVLQRDITKKIWIGIETLYRTKPKINLSEWFGFNVGGGIEFAKDWQIIYTVGKSTEFGLLYYAGFYHTW